ncbi:RNA-processing protein [Candidatus Woesearchaeota archaeon]|nr:RNA-processing protein [Candidatus Woesearchaeota archaeon]
MKEFAYSLRIPKERVAVLIGKDGKVKSQVEVETKSKMAIDSEEGLVTLQGDDALGLYTAREIVTAIGRGFNPEIALQLVKQDYGLDIVSVSDFAKTQNDIIRLRGRVIGEEGKARRVIEELTGTSVCIYGKTIGILGELESIPVARRAIDSLLAGSPHAVVYRWLEKQCKKMRVGAPI